jgi:hypothetical protein
MNPKKHIAKKAEIAGENNSKLSILGCKIQRSIYLDSGTATF